MLSDYGIFNCIIRVPITFPPEKLRGVQLSAMCVPDIRGTQGTFSLFTTRARTEGKATGGEVQIVTRKGEPSNRRSWAPISRSIRRSARCCRRSP